LKISKNRALALFALTLLITSLLLVNMNTPVSAQEPDIYLHGPSLVPIHMHGPPLEPVHMHCQYGIIDLLYPWETLWHQLYPDFCEEWVFTSWENNGEEYLDAGDQIDMTNTATMETRWYHVDRVTMTMRLHTEVPFPETIYVEYKGPYDPYIQPVCTNWTEVYPDYLGVTGGPYHIIDWMDNGNGYLDVCDYIVFEDWPGTWWHVEEYATDLILNEKVMDPIGIWWHELYPSYCNWHELTSWEEPLEDLYPGRLSPGDQIDMINETSGITKWYFVDRVTLTLNVTIIGNPEQFYYFEYKGPFEDMYDVKTAPVCTDWHMVYPDYWDGCFHLDDWIDNCNGVLDYCDEILLEGEWCHVEGLAIDIILNEKIEDPTCTYWHELYPECCVNDYHIEGWEDNGDKLLSPCDNVTMALMPTGLTDDYHVEEVTLTLNLTVLDFTGGPVPPPRIYVEYTGGYKGMYYAKIYPVDTEWHEVCPEFCEVFYLTYWDDNCNGVLSYCDEIELYNAQWGQYLACHVDEVAVDITVKKITVELVHDVAVTNVSPLFTSVPQGWPCPITVTVENQGDFTETFDVDCKYAGSHVTTSPITVNSLPPGGTTALTFCWVTKNVPLSTYTISAYAHQVPSETDLADNTLSDGTVQILAPHPPGFYWKEGFCEYAPSGMPDFDERQDMWDNPPGSQYWTWCSPTAAGNSLWWFDSEYEPAQPPVLPPAMSDGFPLVTSYNPGVWDDHAPQNVQPFIQHLAYLMDTDGQRTVIPHVGTYVSDMQAGLTHYLSWSGVNPLGDVNGDGIVNQTDVNIVNLAMGTMPGVPGWDMRADIDPVTLGWPAMLPANNIIDAADLALVIANLGAKGMFYEHTVNQPDFRYIEEEVERSQDVVLSIGFWYWDGMEWIYREELGHSVTVAGVDSEALKIGISDPMYDAFENGIIPEGRVPIPHTHGIEPPYITHNDAALVSHDIYNVMQWSPPRPPCPGGNWIIVNYAGWCGWEGEPGFYAVIEDAVITSPLGVHDVAVTNVTTSKTGCIPMPTVGQGYIAEVNVTVENQGDFTETFTVTAYADLAVIDSAIVSDLASGSSTTLTLAWDTTAFAKGNYTISAYATPVPSETDTTDNNFIDGLVLVTIAGDVNGDRTCDMADISMMIDAFMTAPGDKNWNPNCDVNNDNSVDMADISIAIDNFMKSW
jgi:hypothetical protein